MWDYIVKILWIGNMIWVGFIAFCAIIIVQMTIVHPLIKYKLKNFENIPKKNFRQRITYSIIILIEFIVSAIVLQLIMFIPSMLL